jgi:hypothetical protein
VLLSDGIYTSPYERHQTLVQGSLAYDGIQNKLSELRPQGLNLDAVEWDRGISVVVAQQKHRTKKTICGDKFANDSGGHSTQFAAKMLMQQYNCNINSTTWPYFSMQP